jgi:hypothetical protein
MFAIDYFSSSPADELYSAFQRAPSTECAKLVSWKGHVVCLWKVCYHTIGIFLKPVIYFTMGSVLWLGLSILKAKNHEFYRKDKENLDNLIKISKNFVFCALVTPASQLFLLFKATIGILYPRAYFKDDELEQYFIELTDIAEEVGCDPKLIECLKQGPYLIEKGFQLNGMKFHYFHLIKRDLALICEKFKDPDFPVAQKVALLNVLIPEESDGVISGSGLKSCPTGIVKLLEQICADMKIPQEPESAISWLTYQHKLDIINLMIIQSEPPVNEQAMRPEWQEILYQLSDQQIHRSNGLIRTLGEDIGLSDDILNRVRQDLIAVMPSKEKRMILLEAFNNLYKKESLMEYLMQKINSHSDGSADLRTLRNHLIQVLSSQISEEDLAASKDEIIQKYKVSDLFADEPIYYIKLHYFLYPDADEHDERNSDFNEKGIEAFAKTLENNPFDYFD